MMTKLSDELLTIIQGNNGLHLYLESLLEDVPHTKRSMLYDGKHGSRSLEPDQIKDAWLEKLAILKKHDKFLIEVYEFDTSQLEKWGPQGGHAPIADLLKDIVYPTFEMGKNSRLPEAFSTPEWAEAQRRTVKLLQRHAVVGLVPESYSKVVNRMRADSKLESNSGFPDFTRRNINEVKQRAIQDAENGTWKTYPAIALFRTYNGKTRLVWMFPMSVNLIEASYFLPLQDRIITSALAEGFFSPWKGFETVRSGVSRVYASGKQVAASDFTSTDAHFQLAASMQVYEVIKECFQPQYRDGLKESIMHMHSIPLVVGPNEMLVGEHGVASGSNWTNFIETVFDIILGYYVEIITKGAVKLLYAIGDDMAWHATRFRDTFREELQRIGESVGQVIRADKTTIFPDKVKTLQRLFQRGYRQEYSDQLRGVYSTIRALKSSVYPERRIKKPKNADDKYVSDMFCARQFMILENCMDHPLFEDFVVFVCDGYKYLIPFAKQSSKRLDAIHREAKLIPGLNPTYNQEKKDKPLSQFLSIKYASTLK